MVAFWTPIAPKCAHYMRIYDSIGNEEYLDRPIDSGKVAPNAKSHKSQPKFVMHVELFREIAIKLFRKMNKLLQRTFFGSSFF